MIVLDKNIHGSKLTIHGCYFCPCFDNPKKSHHCELNEKLDVFSHWMNSTRHSECPIVHENVTINDVKLVAGRNMNVFWSKQKHLDVLHYFEENNVTIKKLAETYIVSSQYMSKVLREARDIRLFLADIKN